VANIGQMAFENCSGLTSVAIPDSVTKVGDDVFWGCNGLTNVTIGNRVTGIAETAFFSLLRINERNPSRQRYQPWWLGI
jgi:hypothetical protein